VHSRHCFFRWYISEWEQTVTCKDNESGIFNCGWRHAASISLIVYSDYKFGEDCEFSGVSYTAEVFNVGIRSTEDQVPNSNSHFDTLWMELENKTHAGEDPLILSLLNQIKLRNMSKGIGNIKRKTSSKSNASIDKQRSNTQLQSSNTVLQHSNPKLDTSEAGAMNSKFSRSKTLVKKSPPLKNATLLLSNMVNDSPFNMSPLSVKEQFAEKDT